MISNKHSKKYMNTNGFTLLEVILSLYIVSICVLFFTSVLYIIKQNSYELYHSEDASSIHQMRLLYALGSSFTLEGNDLKFMYLGKEMYFSFYQNKLILKEGYQVYLRDINYARFSITEGCYYVEYQHLQQDEQSAIIGC